MRIRFLVFLIGLPFFWSCDSGSIKSDIIQDTSFVTRLASETGLDFSNSLELSLKMNIFRYLYFYNGAGIGAGDFNNDGLIDLYFAASQGPNQLYLNEGEFKFKNITAQANISTEKDQWSNGVSVVDINNDGLLDIYVTQLGAYENLEDKNLLFICTSIDKEGIPHYEEKAAEFGLDQSSFGTQALFFDADVDGDLDLVQMNHSIHLNGTFGQKKNFVEKYHPTSGDKYYENQNGKFVDKTVDSGIFSSEIGYGLGIVATDVNLDGYPDFYVSNDFHENDYLYINQKNGIFTEKLTEQMMHTSRFSMGVDAADINNDFYPDFYTLDMLPSDPYILKTSEGEDAFDIFEFKLGYGYNHQYAKNSLQINQGNGVFTETAMYSGLHATDWSWATLLLDFDNDGNKDIFVSNGIPKRMNDIDYINFMQNDDVQHRIRINNMKEDDLSIITQLPEIKLPNRFFRNTGDLHFQDLETKVQDNKDSYSNGAIYADLDNDGDLDIVVNNIDDQVLVYENTHNPAADSYLSLSLKGQKDNINAIGAKLIAYKKDTTILYEKFPVRGFQSSMEIPLHVGVGDINSLDSIILIWPDNTYQLLDAVAKQEVTYQEGLSKFDYTALRNKKNVYDNIKEVTKQIAFDVKHKENPFIEFNNESLIPHMTSSEGPGLAIGDINGDGLEDFFVGGAKRERSAVLLQNKNGTFTKMDSPLFEQDSTYEDVDAIMIDVDLDQDLDLVIAPGGNEFYNKSQWNVPRVYKNDGKGNLSKAEGTFADSIQITASCLAEEDINGDGYPDLFIGGRAKPKQYGVIPPSFIFINDTQGNYVDQTEQYAPDLSDIGMVKDAQWADIDKDGKNDLVLALEWGGIEIFLNRDDSFVQKKIIEQHGWWNFVLPYDFDQDGDIDILAGNLGLNSRLKASQEEPIRMYYSDFDKNGTKEQILSYYLEGKEIPFANKHELETQLSFLKKKYLLAKDFAKATLPELIGKKNLAAADLFYADHFQNSILINDGNMNFTVQPLPDNLQYSLYNDAVLVDANGDNLMDVFMGGNFYDNNVQMGRLDGDYGSLLINKGNCNFEKAFTPDIKIRSQIRSLKSIKDAKGNQMIVVGCNNDDLRILRIALDKNNM